MISKETCSSKKSICLNAVVSIEFLMYVTFFFIREISFYMHEIKNSFIWNWILYLNKNFISAKAFLCEGPWFVGFGVKFRILYYCVNNTTECSQFNTKFAHCPFFEYRFNIYIHGFQKNGTMYELCIKLIAFDCIIDSVIYIYIY